MCVAWVGVRGLAWVRACVCVCMRACVRVCVRACVRACVRVCVRDVFAIYDNNFYPITIILTIIIKIIFLYFIYIAHTDNSPSTIPGYYEGVTFSLYLTLLTMG